MSMWGRVLIVGLFWWSCCLMWWVGLIWGVLILRWRFGFLGVCCWCFWCVVLWFGIIGCRRMIVSFVVVMMLMDCC